MFSGDYDDLTNKPTIPTVPGNATTSADGLMSSGDKTKLDGISAGASIYLWTKAVPSSASGASYNWFLNAYENDTSRYQAVSSGKTYYFVDGATGLGNSQINVITDTWIASNGGSSAEGAGAGGAVLVHGSTTPTNSNDAHYAFIKDNKLFLYTGSAASTSALSQPLIILET